MLNRRPGNAPDLLVELQPAGITYARVTKGTLYFYSVAAMGDDNSGKASSEKGIRH
jgi:hypothetical protein